jgi:hypothetical protein
MYQPSNLTRPSGIAFMIDHADGCDADVDDEDSVALPTAAL